MEKMIPNPDGGRVPIEEDLKRIKRAIELLYQLAEDEGDTWDAHQAEKALERVSEELDR
ncbi:MAG: hypothetical protein KatS3mg018_2463 [Fimbriimonadales bacterium]|nr:MAG: hypothetical protein KatS3mg018_2463 [Fimbriimonadales bacterium]